MLCRKEFPLLVPHALLKFLDIDHTPISTAGLSRFLCQLGRVRYLLVSSGSRFSNMMAKWFSTSFQCRTGIVHRPDASQIAM